MTANNTLPRQAVVDALEGSDLTEDAVYDGYSGRAMYGATCFGIVHDSPGQLLAFFATLGAISEHAYGLDMHDIGRLAQGARQDDLGLSTITYFPGFELS
jgi:hypothetical protein